MAQEATDGKGSWKQVRYLAGPVIEGHVFCIGLKPPPLAIANRSQFIFAYVTGIAIILHLIILHLRIFRSIVFVCLHGHGIPPQDPAHVVVSHHGT